MWLALDNEFGVSGTKIFDTYFNMPEHETSVVFSLLNGLHGYALFNQSGATTFAANLSGDPAARDGISVTGPEPIAAVFDRFERLVTLDDGAGDLFYPVENLARDLARLDPAVGTMEAGQLARSLWSQHYVESLCITAVADENRPAECP